jgi:cell division protein FtsX
VRWWPIALLVLLAGCSESHGSVSTTQPLRTTQLVKVYIAAGSGPADVRAVRSQLEGIRHVQRVVYVSPADWAKANLTKQQQEEFIGPSNPYPPSFHLYLDDFSAVKQVATAALRIPQVANCGSVPCVTYGHLVAPGA